MKLALFASGNGSNVQAIIDAIAFGKLQAEISCLVTDKPQAYVLERVKHLNIPVLIAPLKDFENRDEWELAIRDFVQSFQVDYLVLAGFMRILGPILLNAYPNRILNIHPSYLPNFPGAHGIRDAYQAGVSETGVTVFIVDEGIDTGQILEQVKIKIDPQWTLEELEKKIHQVEHQLYPKVLQQISKKDRSLK